MQSLLSMYYKLGILLKSEILDSRYFIESEYYNLKKWLFFSFQTDKKGSLIWDFIS